MYTEILRSIAGIDVYPVFSLLLFVTFFTAMLIWTTRLDRGRLREFSALPLDETPPGSRTNKSEPTSARGGAA